MAKLSRAIHWYIFDRLSHDLGWRGLKVIFSDAKVPGEGEHKIMQYIRRQRAAPGYDPNTRHTLYGMDADLIMLGLATHDPHFLILRETITDNRPQAQGPRCFICGVVGHRADECSGILEEEKAKAEAAGKMPVTQAEPGLMDKPFQFLQLNVLREYLAHDLYVPNLPFAWDLERCIDDFVFLAFFVGNDFLPHLPLLEIREGAIERLVGIYKRLLPSLGGYISEDAGSLNLSRIDVILGDLGVVEDSIFKNRKSKEDYLRQRDANRSAQMSSRRAQTLKARESAKQFAEEQGFTAVKSGISIAGRAVQPHIKEQIKKESEIRDDDMTGAKPIYSEAQIKKGIKRKTDEEESTTSDAGHASKKKKKSDLSSKNTSGSDSEVDSDDDPSDPSFKPSASSDSDGSPSSSDSDDDEAEAKKKRKAKKRKAKQAAKKQAAATKIKTEDEPMTAASSSESATGATLDSIKADSTGKLSAKLDVAAAEIDFSALLNSKLRALERPEPKEGETDEDRDPVRFGEEGWKGRYYSSKMHINRDKKEDGVVFHKLFKSYAEGLAWVMKYYYAGCPSWSWYYPFHYAPMASDLGNLDRYKISFDLSEPFKPIGQLMGVLPAKSAHALPEPCQELMINPLSPIIDFYPDDFPLDLNGKKALWQAVALLPWIDETRLLHELKKVEPQFNGEEQDRNSLGVDYLFVHKSNLMANSIYALYMQHPTESLAGKTPLECSQLAHEPVDINESHGMNGTISPYVAAGELDGSLQSEVGLDSVDDISVMSVIFTDPPNRPHVCALLPGVIMPKPVLGEGDFDEANRGGPQQFNSNNSRNNQQRYNNQRDSNRQLQGVVPTHGGQAAQSAPRFGDAPSHFQQGDVSSKIWSSGFNQRQGHQGHQGHQGGYQHQPHNQHAGQHHQYQQQQRGGYQQPHAQQGYRHAPAASYQQPAYHQSGYQQSPSQFPPPPQPAPHSFSHARGPPPRQNNHLAALQAQIQSSTAAQRAQHMQKFPPPPPQGRR